MEVEFDNHKIKVIIIKKKIKNIYFRFDNDLNLVVSANKYISEEKIIKLIRENQKSLIKLYDKAKKNKAKLEEFWYLGIKYDIIINKNVNGVIFEGEKVYCQSIDILNKFMNKQIKEIFTKEVNNLRTIIKTPDFTLRFRKMKSRWGVCNYKLNIITLNTELIKYSKDILKYVIVHEMCHFYHHNHGPLFWNMVAKYYPNYKEIRKELRS